MSQLLLLSRRALSSGSFKRSSYLKIRQFRTEDEKQNSALYSARSPVFLRSIKTTLGLCQRGNGCGCTTSVTQERGTLLKKHVNFKIRAESCKLLLFITKRRSRWIEFWNRIFSFICKHMPQRNLAPLQKNKRTF